MALDKLTLMGYVKNDPIVRTTRKGDKLFKCIFETAVQFGNIKEFSLIGWQQNADRLERDFKKGTEVVIEGKLLENKATMKVKGVILEFKEIQVIEYLLINKTSKK